MLAAHYKIPEQQCDDWQWVR